MPDWSQPHKLLTPLFRAPFRPPSVPTYHFAPRRDTANRELDIREPGDDYGNDGGSQTGGIWPLPIFGPAPDSAKLPSQAHRWARERYLRTLAERLNGVPGDPTASHVPNTLSEDERGMLGRALSLFQQAAPRMGRQLLTAMLPAIANPECEAYLRLQIERKRREQDQLRDLATHLRMAPDTAETEAALVWAEAFIDALPPGTTRVESPRDKQRVLRALCVYYLIEEGLILHTALPMVLGLGRRDKLPGVDGVFRAMARHNAEFGAFGIDLINQIRIENPDLWNAPFQHEAGTLLRNAVELQTRYFYACLPRGILGLNAPMLEAYLRLTANRRAIQIGLPLPFGHESNPFPWMADISD